MVVLLYYKLFCPKKNGKYQSTKDLDYLWVMELRFELEVLFRWLAIARCNKSLKARRSLVEHPTFHSGK